MDMNETKKLFDVAEYSKVWERFGEAYGYPYAIGRFIDGSWAAAIAFPKDVKIHEKYMRAKLSAEISKEEKQSLKEISKIYDKTRCQVSKNNWFTKLMTENFHTSDMDIYETIDNRQIFLVTQIGFNRNPYSTEALLIKEKDFVKAARKYKNELNSNPKLKKIFSDIRKRNNILEAAVDNNDHAKIAEMIPPNVKTIITFEETDIIEAVEKFLEKISAASSTEKAHEGILNKIGNTIKNNNKNGDKK